jgi:hypothetical protein
VLKPRPRRVVEVERKILDDEEIIHRSPSASFNGVLGVVVGLEMTLDRRRPASGSTPMASMSWGRQVLAVHKGRCSPSRTDR